MFAKNYHAIFSFSWLKVTEQIEEKKKHTAQEMKFSIKDFSSKCDQICSDQILQ